MYNKNHFTGVYWILLFNNAMPVKILFQQIFNADEIIVLQFNDLAGLHHIRLYKKR